MIYPYYKINIFTFIRYCIIVKSHRDREEKSES